MYRSGDLWLPKPVVTVLDTYLLGSKDSLFYLNLWHINHFLSGVFFGLFHLYGREVPSPFLTYLILHTVWELWQLWIGMTPRSLRGALDVSIDTVLGILGFLLTRQFSADKRRLS